MRENVSVFLDESGKDKNKISLIGSILIPNNIYYSNSVKELNNSLINNEFKFHLTDYRNSDLNNYLHLFNTLLDVTNLKFNVVVFKRSSFKNHTLHGKIDDMVYSKIPERSIYGSLRGFSKFTDVEANIFIEYAEEYKNRQLDKLIKNQLNTHSLYRYDNFKVHKVALVGKNKQIGVEFTDVCLGILRIILENDDVSNRNVSPNKFSKTLAYKKKLVFTLLNSFPNFFKNIDLFELDDKGTLDKVEIDKYINLFVAKYLNELESIPEFYDIINR